MRTMCVVQLNDRDPWSEQCVRYSSMIERSMVRTICVVQLNGREIHGENNVWGTSQ